MTVLETMNLLDDLKQLIDRYGFNEVLEAIQALKAWAFSR